MTYYNTTRMQGDQLVMFTRKAATQNEIIYQMFQRSITLTPSLCQRMCEQQGNRWPITSVRRAITNLTKDGLLEKTDEKRPGAYNRPEYVWRIKQ